MEHVGYIPGLVVVTILTVIAGGVVYWDKRKPRDHHENHDHPTSQKDQTQASSSDAPGLTQNKE